MRNVWIALALVGIFTCSCSSDDGGSGGSGGSAGGGSKLGGCYGTPGQTCTGVSAYENCVIDKCDSNYKECLGSSYMSGTFSGACADYMNCAVACPCDSTNQSCAMDCVQNKMSTECQTCLTELTNCVQSSGCTQPVCTSGSGGSGGGTAGSGGSSGSGTCADLAACCATIQDALKSSCDALVSGGVDANCGAALSSWQAGGLCP